ncbi:ankyrin repeat-containing domain protein [Nemania diffusa]|nr:ankyrin repeat-containing domain protein [Nemania diffusa]
MSAALRLPVELLYIISGYLDDQADLSSWSRSCRTFYAGLTPLLYHNARDDPAAMCWACDEGLLGTILRLLGAGANSNIAWVPSESRWLTQLDLHNAHRPLSPLPRKFHHKEDERVIRAIHRNKLIDQLAENDASRLDILANVIGWLMSLAAIDYATIVFFEEDFYDISAAAHRDTDQAEQWRLWEANSRMRLWAAQPGRDDNDPFFKTFAERCYWTPLHIAAARGNDKLVSLLLDNGADINAPSHLFCTCAIPPSREDVPLWTPLHTAMCHGHESTTRLLLSRGASTNVTTRYEGQDENRFTALHSACVVDLLDAGRALIEGGYQTDVMVLDHENLTPFAYAFFQGSWAMIDFLLEHGADIDAKIGPFTALGHACLLGYYAEALRLLDLGAIPQCEPGIHGERPIYLHLIAAAGAPYLPSRRASRQEGFQLELVNRLMKLGISVNQRGIDGTTALMGAAEFHRVDVVKALLHAGADVRANMSHWYEGPEINANCNLLNSTTALSKAAKYLEYPKQTPRGAMLGTVQALLEAMAETPAPRLKVVADVEESDTTDDATISNAVRTLCSLPNKHEDKLEVVALLLGHNRAVEMANAEPNLVYASLSARNLDISDLLLQNGFDQPSDEDLYNSIWGYFECDDFVEGLRHILHRFSLSRGTCIWGAVEWQREKCVEFLFNEGVSVTSMHRCGVSLLDVACRWATPAIVELLLKNGADPNGYDEEGELPTIVAADGKRVDVVRLLLNYGALIHRVPFGEPPEASNMAFLDHAISHGQYKVVEEIVNHKNYGYPTDEEISRHWSTLLYPGTYTEPFMLRIVLDSGRFDPNQVYTISSRELRSELTTPLHVCLANGYHNNIQELLAKGANIHKQIVGPNGQTSVPVEFPGTTPLLWAIISCSVSIVRTLIEQEVLTHGQFLGPMEMGKTSRRDLMLLYAKAACCRQSPEMFSLLFQNGLDCTICDEDKNTIIHIICDVVERERSYIDDDWIRATGNKAREHKFKVKREINAKRSAWCLVECLKWGVPYNIKNKKGVSGTDCVLEILKYSGYCQSRQIFTRAWGEILSYDEDSGPRLTAKVHVNNQDEDDFKNLMWWEPAKAAVSWLYSQL